jgi:hypothetical protein
MEVRLPSRDGEYEVTAVAGTMAKAEPRLLLKAGSTSGKDPKRQGDKGAAMGGPKDKPGGESGARAASSSPQERPRVPKRGAPDGEPEFLRGRQRRGGWLSSGRHDHAAAALPGRAPGHTPYP